MARHGDYRVGELARLARVSVRTLHHYDAVGLLRPTRGAGGYRLYGHDEVLRLQEILILRELGLPLAEIARALDAEGRDRAEVLTTCRTRLAAELHRHRRLLRTIDRTIADLRGEGTMTDEDLYAGFPPETQARHEAWLTEQGGPDMPARIAEARAPGPDDMDDLARIEGDLVAAFEAGAAPGDAALAPLLEAHRAWVARMWRRPCPLAAHAGLADLYEAHPDFAARYERLSPGFGPFLAGAIRAHAAPGDDRAG